MNVTKIILSRFQIFHLKCTKFNFGWGSVPYWGSSQRSPIPSSWIWEKRKEKGEGRGERRGGGGRMIPGPWGVDARVSRHGLEDTRRTRLWKSWRCIMCSIHTLGLTDTRGRRRHGMYTQYIRPHLFLAGPQGWGTRR